MSETISPYVLNAMTASISGLSKADRLLYHSESIRFEVIQTMVRSLLQQLQEIEIQQPIEALQINEKQVLSFFNQTPEIISIEQANQSDKRYLSLENLRQLFNLDLNIREFDLSKRL